MKKLLIVAICFSQSACASTITPTRMSFDELRTFKVDCNRREEKYKFLESQKYSQTDRLKVALQMTGITGIALNLYNGTMQDSADAMDSKHEAMIKHAQRELRENCPIQDEDRRYLEEQQRRLNLR